MVKEEGKQEGANGSTGLMFMRGKRKITVRVKKLKIQLADRKKVH